MYANAIVATDSLTEKKKIAAISREIFPGKIHKFRKIITDLLVSVFQYFQRFTYLPAAFPLCYSSEFCFTYFHIVYRAGTAAPGTGKKRFPRNRRSIKCKIYNALRSRKYPGQLSSEKKKVDRERKGKKGAHQ